MRLKSYFAATVEGAIQDARRELGEEALLLHSRPASPEARELGAYEVVFALADAARGDVKARASAPPAAPQSESRLWKDELEALRAQMESVTRAVSRSGSVFQRPEFARFPELGRLHASLVRCELVGPALEEILTGVVGLLDPATSPDDVAVRKALTEAIRRLVCSAEEVCSASSERVIILVGPAGSGKTSLLVKLAARYGLPSRRPGVILSVDPLRVGSAEQLRMYASILGLPFHSSDLVCSLNQAVIENERKRWIWIDTAGLGPKDMDVAVELGEWIAARRDVQTILVLPATMRACDAGAAVRRFLPLHPGSVAFTHLDETHAYGAMIEVALEHRLPISYLSGGQVIPEDVEPATAEQLCALLIGAEQKRARPAAASL